MIFVSSQCNSTLFVIFQLKQRQISAEYHQVEELNRQFLLQAVLLNLTVTDYFYLNSFSKRSLNTY
jgi:hypothetical protein